MIWTEKCLSTETEPTAEYAVEAGSWRSVDGVGIVNRGNLRALPTLTRQDAVTGTACRTSPCWTEADRSSSDCWTERRPSIKHDSVCRSQRGTWLSKIKPRVATNSLPTYPVLDRSGLCSPGMRECVPAQINREDYKDVNLLTESCCTGLQHQPP